MGRSLAFVQPRGGIGKSTACAQLAAALAAARPDLVVTVIDASLHADATHALVGGMKEPVGDGAVSSRGEVRTCVCVCVCVRPHEHQHTT